MPDFINGMRSSTYKKETLDVLQRLVKTMPAYRELVFFVKAARDYYLADPKTAVPDIVVIGSGVPEELVFAAGRKPYWILGGSRVNSMWAEDMVPRDTDPVSRSSLGFMMAGFPKSALILIPLVNDSARKLAYILMSMGFHVHTFHFPPVKDARSLDEWNRQYEACRSAIGFHIKRPLTERALKNTRGKIQQAKKQIRDFLEAADGAMSGACRMFVISRYYCVDDLAEWSRRLESLTARIRKGDKGGGNGKSRVLLLGSPVYFPNYKVPFLIEEAGLELFLQADYTTLSIQDDSGLESVQREHAADIFYRNNASPAYVKKQCNV